MENQLTIFSDDTVPRFTVATCLLDYSTMALSDKFGNIAIVKSSIKKTHFRFDLIEIDLFCFSVTNSVGHKRRRRNRSNGQQRTLGSRFAQRSFEQSKNFDNEVAFSPEK